MIFGQNEDLEGLSWQYQMSFLRKIRVKLLCTPKYSNYTVSVGMNCQTKHKEDFEENQVKVRY